jgi:hypothetical protein
MRPAHCTLSPALVCRHAVQHLVSCLQLTDYGVRVSATLLAQLLLWAAATRRSLSALCQRCRQAPSDESVRLALLHALPPEQQQLQGRLLAGLHALVPRHAQRRPLPLAIDLHYRPYYGRKATPGTIGGQRKDGTKQFWAYATCVVLLQGLRLSVGLVPVVKGQTLAELVAGLLTQAAQAGVRPAWLLLDRGFYAADVVHWLQQQRIAFVMPMIRRGNAAQGSGTQPFFARTAATGWSCYTWTARPRRWDQAAGKLRKTAAITVTVRVCVVARAGKRPWVYVAHRLNWSPALLRQRYRLRFGIETSYRQLGACLALTTSKDARVRLLLVGVALLLRQWWVWLHWEMLAADDGEQRQLQLQRLRLDDLKLWLHLHLANCLGYLTDLQTQQPMPDLT